MNENDDKPSPLVAAMQAETDGAAKRFIRDVATNGSPAAAFEAARGALAGGASPAAVREALNEPGVVPLLDGSGAAVVPTEDAPAGDGAAVFSLDEIRKRKAAEEAEREEVSEAEKYLARLRRAQHMLSALVKKAGRLRISRRELEAIGPRSSFAVKVDKDTGDVIVTWLGG